MKTGEDWPFPAAGFAGQGRLLDRAVRCLTPEVEVLCPHRRRVRRRRPRRTRSPRAWRGGPRRPSRPWPAPSVGPFLTALWPSTSFSSLASPAAATSWPDRPAGCRRARERPRHARRQGDAATGWTVASIARRSRRGVEDRRELPETGTVPDGPVATSGLPPHATTPRVHLMSSSLNPCRNRRSTNVGRPASLMPARLVQCGTIKSS
jgi:hypothetical protein